MSESSEILSVGQQLKNAREALKLSVEEVAQKTNLKKNHIEALENDIFILPNVPPVFVRGYVRNYARFLRLPESLMQQANYGEVTIPKEVKKAAPIQVSNNHKSQSRWVKWLTGFILLCAVGMTLAWWWQEHKKDELSRDSLVGSNEIVLNNESAMTENNAVEIPVVAEAVVTNQNGVEVAAEANSPVGTETAVAGNIQAVENSTENANQQSEPVSQTAATILAVPAQVEMITEPEDSVVEPVAAVNNDELRIEIQGGQSWITVRSSKSKKSLAEKLYNDGDVLTFNNNEQYRLTIGAPANVKLYYKGEQIPLKVDGRVVRIKLPQ